jgi:hypothetical protein
LYSLTGVFQIVIFKSKSFPDFEFWKLYPDKMKHSL